jgi:phage terminase small subunit
MGKQIDNSYSDELKLTAKEERFCYQYVLYLNATKAAIEAGYAAKSAAVTGCQLLRKPNIQAHINYLKANLAETAELSALRVLKEYEDIAFAKSGKLNDGTEVKVFDKQRALDSIREMLSLDVKDSIDFTQEAKDNDIIANIFGDDNT